MALHILKLAVGIDSVAHLAQVQKARRAERRANGDGAGTFHFTRSFPRRAEEVLDGGSLYWVIRGEIAARQKILGFEERVRPGRARKRCAIRLAAAIIRTVPTPHRAFQGWRYLADAETPPDLEGKAGTRTAKGSGRLPPELARELRELGLL